MLLWLIGEQLLPILYGPGSALGPVVWGIAAVTTALSVLFGSGVFGGVSGATLSAIQKIRDQVSTAVDIAKRFAWTIARMAGALLVALGDVIEHLIKPILAALKALGSKLSKLYTDIIVPMLKALEHIRKQLQDIYNNWLRPVILAIQKVRQFLSILRAFGIKWAGDLDARLARIEGKIVGPWLWLVQQLNGYGSWLNIILTTRATIQGIVFKRTLLENSKSLTALFWGSQNFAGGSGDNGLVYTARTPWTLADARNYMQLDISTSLGPIATDGAQARAIFTQVTTGV